MTDEEYIDIRLFLFAFVLKLRYTFYIITFRKKKAKNSKRNYWFGRATPKEKIMSKYKLIIEYYQKGNNNTKIATLCGCSRTTVWRVFQRVKTF